MRMTLKFENAKLGPVLIQRLDDGTNDLYLNGTKMSQSSVVGSGYWTQSFGSNTYTFYRYSGNFISGMNITIRQLSTNTFEFVPVTQMAATYTIDMIYPVGAMIISYNNSNPQLRFPGTKWERVTNSSVPMVTNYYVWRRTA